MHAEKENTIKVTVEKATPKDLPIVISIYTQHNGCCTNVGCNNTFVARNESLGVVGAVTVQVREGSVELRTIGIEKDLQRKGIGSQLLAQVIDELRKDGASKLTITLGIPICKYKSFFEKRGIEVLSQDEHGGLL